MSITEYAYNPYGYWKMEGVPDIPDAVSGTTYRSNFSSNVDGWSIGGITGGTASASASNGELVFQRDGTGAYLLKSLTLPLGSTVRIIAKIDGGASSTLVVGGNGAYNKTSLVLGYSKYVIFDTLVTTAGWNISIYTGSRGTNESQTVTIKAIYIGTGLYTTPLLDSTGRGNHGTINGCIPVDGVSGKALAFDKSYVGYPSGTGVFGPSDFSIGLWIKTDGTADGFALSNRGKSYSNGYGIIVSGTVLAGYIINTSPNVELNTPTIDVSLNAWHFVCLVVKRSTNTMEFSVDNGTPVSASIAAAPNALDSDQLCLGSYADLSAYSVSGLIVDEVSMFNRALSASEVLGLYNSKSIPVLTVPTYSGQHEIDVKMASTETPQTNYPTWNFSYNDGNVAYVMDEERSKQDAEVACFMQRGSVPQLPYSGPDWLAFLTGKVSFGDLDSMIQGSLTDAGTPEYSPVYSASGDKLITTVQRRD